MLFPLPRRYVKSKIQIDSNDWPWNVTLGNRVKPEAFRKAPGSLFSWRSYKIRESPAPFFGTLRGH